MAQKHDVTRWMHQQLTIDEGVYVDSGGEWEYTKLAENAAQQFSLYEDEDATIPEWVFDAAVDVCDSFNEDEDED